MRALITNLSFLTSGLNLLIIKRQRFIRLGGWKVGIGTKAVSEQSSLFAAAAAPASVAAPTRLVES